MRKLLREPRPQRSGIISALYAGERADVQALHRYFSYNIGV
jgi:hypothetical protein